MSESYTDSNYSGTESYAETSAEQHNTESPSEVPNTTNSEEEGEAEKAVNNEGSKDEEEAKKEPPPEPEPDPLEGLTYDDDDPEDELPPYGELEYWEKRYTEDPEIFEWYQDPEALMPLVKELFNPEGAVLVIGTGTSELAPMIQQNGFENVTAIDFAKQPIKIMRKKYADAENGANVSWKVMDVRKMNKFGGENSFVSIIDKGTLDCLFQLGEEDVNQALSEISRILKKGGVFVCVSYRPEEDMRPFFDRPTDLLLELEKVEKLKKPLPSEEPHYIYIMRKVQKLIT